MYCAIKQMHLVGKPQAKHCGHSHTLLRGIHCCLGEHTTEDNGETDSCIGGAPVIAGLEAGTRRSPSSRLAWAAK